MISIQESDVKSRLALKLKSPELQMLREVAARANTAVNNFFIEANKEYEEAMRTSLRTFTAFNSPGHDLELGRVKQEQVRLGIASRHFRKFSVLAVALPLSTLTKTVLPKGTALMRLAADTGIVFGQGYTTGKSATGTYAVQRNGLLRILSSQDKDAALSEAERLLEEKDGIAFYSLDTDEQGVPLPPPGWTW